MVLVDETISSPTRRNNFLNLIESAADVCSLWCTTKPNYGKLHSLKYQQIMTQTSEETANLNYGILWHKDTWRRQQQSERNIPAYQRPCKQWFSDKFYMRQQWALAQGKVENIHYMATVCKTKHTQTQKSARSLRT